MTATLYLKTTMQVKSSWWFISLQHETVFTLYHGVISYLRHTEMVDIKTELRSLLEEAAFKCLVSIDPHHVCDYTAVSLAHLCF